MSASPERREAIDIEEFERRLRAPEALEPNNDPLADLARLVAGQGRSPARDPFANIFNEGAPAMRPRETGLPEGGAIRPPPVPMPPAPQPRQPQDLDFPDLRPFMRGGMYPPPPPPPAIESRDPPFGDAAFDPPVVPEPLQDEFHESLEYEDWAEEDSVPPDSVEPAAPTARSRKPLYLTAAVIALGFVGIAGSLAWRGGANGPAGVAIIKAASGPTKVQPAGLDASNTPSEPNMLDKSTPPQVKKVVSREEQPIDVGAAEKSPRVIPLGDGGPSAASIPTPPPPVRVTDQPPASIFPEPKKVKTVAVRADGSIISTETAPAPAAQPRQTTPKNATPKSENRAPTTTAEGRPAPRPQPKPAQPKPVAAKPAPKQVAAVEPKDNAPDDEAAAPEETTRPKPASGGFAVQLAAAGSEAEARQTAQRLGEKYSSALGGRRPSIQKVPDKALYRIRVGGMTREAAISSCEQIKASGGACFIAH